jgi:beta-glucosidase
MKRALLLAALLVACDDKPAYDPAEIAAHQPLKGLDAKHFWLGTATASHQIEGGLDDDWTQWEHGIRSNGQPHIYQGQSAAVACDSWNRWRDDLDAMLALGVNAYRLSIDWSRLQPGPSQPLDDRVVARYREQLAALRAAGVRPVVTLYHFTLPLWAGDAQHFGWESTATAEQLADFCGRAGDAFGDLVDEWITINEPNVVAVNGWLRGEFPPGHSGDQQGMAHALERQLIAHAKCSAALRAHDTVDADGDGRATFIGLAHHVRIFEPASPSPLDAEVAGLTDSFFNASVPDALATGRIQLSVPGSVSLDESVPGLKGSADFLGLNYYTRDFIRADLTDPSLSVQYTPTDRPTNSLGWDIYPEGLERSLVRFARYKLPLVITENGTTTEDDSARADFLRAHLYALDRARAEGVDVRGYLHWSLLDNFEWAEGYRAHFGLYAVSGIGTETGTLDRVPRQQSGDVFREAANNLGLQPH